MNNIADKNKMAYVGSKPGNKPDDERDSDAWFTPAIYIEMVRKVLGKINLDPFSSKYANQTVKADRYFDEKHSAFENEWFDCAGTVFMNPPYGRSLIGKSISEFIKHHSNKKIKRGIVLVNNATETIWFKKLLNESSAICLTSKRIAFVNVDGKRVSGNTRGQVFFYFGGNVDKFKSVFSKIGTVLIKA